MRIGCQYLIFVSVKTSFRKHYIFINVISWRSLLCYQSLLFIFLSFYLFLNVRNFPFHRNPDIVSGFLLADLRRWLVRYAEAKIDFGKLSSFYKIVKQVCVALRTNALDQLYKSVQDLDEEWLQLKWSQGNASQSVWTANENLLIY